MKKAFYLGLTVIFCFGAIYFYHLPTSIDAHEEENIVLDGEFEALPNIDFAEEITEAIKNKDYETAIVMSEAGMEIFPEDAPAMASMREAAINNENFKTTPLGQAYSFTSGFVTGNIENLASGAGSVASDFFLWGDIRDLTKELVFSDDPDLLIIALSGVGIASTVIPTLDGPISLAKTMKKVSALSEPMTKYLINVLERVHKLPPQDMAKELKLLLAPMYDLAKAAKSFGQAKLLLKACKDNSAIKFLATLGAKSKKSLQDLGEVLAVIGTKNNALSQKVVEYVVKTGGKGIGALKKGLKKGRRGIELVLKNPHVVKTASRTTKIFSKFVPNLWKTFAKSLPHIAKAARILLTALSSAFSAWFFALFTRNLFPKKSDPNMKLSAGMAHDGPNSSLSLSPLSNSNTAICLTDENLEMAYIKIFSGGFFEKRHLPIYISGVIFVLIIIFMLLPSLPPFAFTASSDAGNFNVTTNDFTGIDLLIFIMLISFIVFLFLVCSKIKLKLITIYLDKKLDKERKLQLLDNMDIWFDLPLYGGLAMTILAFIVICLTGATNSRYLAYIATFIGIICTTYMRLMYLHNVRREILISDNVRHI